MAILRSKFAVTKSEDKKVTAVEANEVVKVVSLVAAVDVCGAIAGVTIGSCKEVCEVGAHAKAACNISSKCVAEGI